jgi:hypothetical protein
MTKPQAEVANLFRAVELGASNAGAEVYPGYPDWWSRRAKSAA